MKWIRSICPARNPAQKCGSCKAQAQAGGTAAVHGCFAGTEMTAFQGLESRYQQCFCLVIWGWVRQAKCMRDIVSVRKHIMGWGGYMHGGPRVVQHAVSLTPSASFNGICIRQ